MHQLAFILRNTEPKCGASNIAATAKALVNQKIYYNRALAAKGAEIFICQGTKTAAYLLYICLYFFDAKQVEIHDLKKKVIGGLGLKNSATLP